MGNLNKKGISLLYAFPAIIMIFTFTLLYAWVPPLKNVVFMYFGLAIGLLVCQQYYQKSMMIYFVLYVLVLFGNALTKDFWINNIEDVLREILKLLLPGLMGYAIITSNDNKLLRITAISFLVMLIVNAIGTSTVETIVPGSIRTLEHMRHEGDEASMIRFFRYGMANYQLPSGLVTIIPMLVLGVKMNSRNKKKRYFLLIGLIASMMLTYYSGSTTALLLGIFGLLVGFFIKTKAGKRQLITLALLGIALTTFLSNDDWVLSSLNSFDRFVGYEGFFHDKVDDFENYILYGEMTGDMAGRERVYTETWTAVVTSPFWGENKELGGHSLLLDHWGYLGLIGLIPFMAFVLAQIKLSAKYIPEDTKLFYYICVFISFMMMLIKNMNSWECWLCLFTILPVLAKYIYSESNIIIIEIKK